jgi:hypothetical protein
MLSREELLKRRARALLLLPEVRREVDELLRQRSPKLVPPTPSRIDFSLLPALIELGGFHYEAGVREFPAWSVRMLEDLGRGALDYLWGTFDLLETHYAKAAARRVGVPAPPAPSLPLHRRHRSTGTSPSGAATMDARGRSFGSVVPQRKSGCAGTTVLSPTSGRSAREAPGPKGNTPPARGGGSRGGESGARRSRHPDQGPLARVPPENVSGAEAERPVAPLSLPGPRADEGRHRKLVSQGLPLFQAEELILNEWATGVCIGRIAAEPEKFRSRERHRDHARGGSEDRE